MIETGWSIVDWNVESFLFTYSEEEKQSNEINKANAKKLYSPEFVPFYLEEVREWWLQASEWIIYWFIRFYMKNWWWRFYFNSEQLGEILWISAWTIDNTISKFVKLGIIETSRKVKSGGWTLRFINAVYTFSDLIHRWGLISSTDELHIKKNKLNKNKNIHITTIVDDDVFSFLSNCSSTSVASKKECTLLFWKFKTFEEIRELVAEAKKRTIFFSREDLPTIRALKWLDLFLKDHNGVQKFMDMDFENNVDYDSRANREEQLYYCRGNAQPHY